MFLIEKQQQNCLVLGNDLQEALGNTALRSVTKQVIYGSEKYISTYLVTSLGFCQDSKNQCRQNLKGSYKLALIKTHSAVRNFCFVLY